jgi:hypothetical protein
VKLVRRVKFFFGWLPDTYKDADDNMGFDVITLVVVDVVAAVDVDGGGGLMGRNGEVSPSCRLPSFSYSMS